MLDARKVPVPDGVALEVKEGRGWSNGTQIPNLRYEFDDCLPDALAPRRVRRNLALLALLRPTTYRPDACCIRLDGKALRGSRGTQLVSAVNTHSGRTMGVEAVADKSNEIPAGQTLLDRLELDGTIALMDALHTQVQTARSIVQEGGGDFVLFVKGNQSGLLAQAQHFLPEDFSPSTLARRARPRPDRMAWH